MNTPEKRERFNEDHEVILSQIKRKILAVNAGLSYRMDFSAVVNFSYYAALISVLTRVDKDKTLWGEIITFMEQNLDMRTVQAL